MNVEVEIPIWFNGKLKWISNLTRRSTCSDVIQAILTSEGQRTSETDENYNIYECWRGVERPLKCRCRLLKLWNSWAGECSNVTLTLRTSNSQSDSTQILIRQQDKKLKKLKRQIKRTDKQIERFSSNKSPKKSNEDVSGHSSFTRFYRSIIDVQKKIELNESLIRRLLEEINEENHRCSSNDSSVNSSLCSSSRMDTDRLQEILVEVNQTLVFSRELNNESEHLDRKIRQTNEMIESRLSLLDELELDLALEQNIELDSLDEQNLDDDKTESDRSTPWSSSVCNERHVEPSRSIDSCFSSSLNRRPTAIVEPNFVSRRSTVDDEALPSIVRSTLSPSIRLDDQLVTLV